MKKHVLTLVLAVLFIIPVNSNAQVRTAVFPFENMDGQMEYNIWCYNLQDSLIKSLKIADSSNNMYEIVPVDSLEQLLAEMNLNPNNPQYKSDMWKVAEKLNAEKVILGTFNIRAERFLINAYIYDVKIKLPHPRYKAQDIFKAEENIYECVPIIVKRLLPAFSKS